MLQVLLELERLVLKLVQVIQTLLQVCTGKAIRAAVPCR